MLHHQEGTSPNRYMFINGANIVNCRCKITRLPGVLREYKRPLCHLAKVIDVTLKCHTNIAREDMGVKIVKSTADITPSLLRWRHRSDSTPHQPGGTDFD
ncbi:hypothetical protein KIN20_018951 [Parelaphostrongylus tenuis]|uniref:Uncharacterized protein n=1 Tax=Parelaphostrongylus tenuis TaxID=148309 RepID=A0AAD5MNR2_PARTN|nr:hypothetical protein KIN20_018951 [Parelaphostrongylus tenuis]